jgi:hypothetical protein
MSEEFVLIQAIGKQAKTIALLQDRLEKYLDGTIEYGELPEVLSGFCAAIADATQAWETLIRVHRELAPAVRPSFSYPATFGDDEA